MNVNIKPAEVTVDKEMLEFAEKLMSLISDARGKGLSKKKIVTVLGVLANEHCPKDWK